MATIIKITKAYDVRRYEEYFVDADDLSPDQLELLDTSVIHSADGCDDERVEDIIGNMSDSGIEYRDSDKPEVSYVIESTLDPATAARDLAEAWGTSRPMENEEVFWHLSCGELQPILDLLRSVGANNVAQEAEYAHAKCDYDPNDAHHGLYLKREVKGDL